jgi:heme-degrading monooxygenase HmoA
MICALTVRTLKPGTFDDFRQAFMTAIDPDNPPEGWVRFNMVRNVDNPDEVTTFGFFDGTVDELRAQGPQDEERAAQLEAIAPFVAGTGADGLYEIVEEFVA